MNTAEMLDAYVRDVVAHLPRRTRRDVALELRALLGEEIAARASAEGRAPDRAMVMSLLAGFGRPGEAARRYHERPPVIDPTDTHHFVIWGVGGAVALAVLSAANAPGAAEKDLFLRWLGVLVIVFAAMGWWRRHRRPGVLGWKPKRAHDDWPRWLTGVCLVLTLVFPVWMYVAPVQFTRTVFLGLVTTDGLALTGAFEDSWQRMATKIALMMLAGGYAVALAMGRWTRGVWWTHAVAHVVLGQLLVLHSTAMVGPGGPFRVFESAEANRIASPIFALVGAGVILSGLYDAYRAWAQVRTESGVATRAARSLA
jgi:hypothetical protein